MKFQVKARDGQTVLTTLHPECIVTDNLLSMQEAGLTFYLDDKHVSKEKLCSFLAESAVNKNQVSAISKELSTIDIDSLDFTITSRTVICTTTGKVYRNQKEAAEDLNLDPASISYSISTNTECKGYKFQKLQELQQV